VGTSKEHDLLDQLFGKRYVHGNCAGLGAQAVIPARQLCNHVGVKLLHMLHKLTNADALGLLEHVCDVVPLLLSRIVGEHGEKVGH
jgi:hypothetical protein